MAQKTPLIVRIIGWFSRLAASLAPNWTTQFLIRLFSSPRKLPVKPEYQAALKKSDQQELQTEFGKLAIYVWGKSDRIAYLVHGWEGNAGQLTAFVPLLQVLGLQVITFDAPAHGKSEGKRSNMAVFCRAFKEVINAYGSPELIIGHSLGSSAAIYTLAEHQIAVNKLVLLSVNNRIEEVFLDFQKLLGIGDRTLERMLEEINAQYGVHPAKMVMSAYGQKAEVDQVLLIHDPNDKAIPFFNATEMAKEWNKVKLISLKGIGHYRMLQNPQVIQNVRAFLEA